MTLEQTIEKSLFGRFKNYLGKIRNSAVSKIAVYSLAGVLGAELGYGCGSETKPSEAECQVDEDCGEAELYCKEGKCFHWLPECTGDEDNDGYYGDCEPFDCNDDDDSITNCGEGYCIVEEGKCVSKENCVKSETSSSLMCLVDSFELPYGSPRGLDWDGGHLWGTDGSKIYQLNKIKPEITDSFEVPFPDSADPEYGSVSWGLAYGFLGDLWAGINYIAKPEEGKEVEPVYEIQRINIGGKAVKGKIIDSFKVNSRPLGLVWDTNLWCLTEYHELILFTPAGETVSSISLGGEDLGDLTLNPHTKNLWYIENQEDWFGCEETEEDEDNCYVERRGVIHEITLKEGKGKKEVNSFILTNYEIDPFLDSVKEYGLYGLTHDGLNLWVTEQTPSESKIHKLRIIENKDSE